MFKCTSCGGSIVKRVSVTSRRRRVVCAFCNTVNIIIKVAESVLDTDTLAQEPEALTFMEPVYEEEEEEVVRYPWLETPPEEQFEEMRRELNIPPDVEIPPPGPHAPTVFPERELGIGEYPKEHDESFYRVNMGRLWGEAWEQLGDILGDEVFEEFAYPMLTQFADTPEYVDDLFTPKGGSRLRGQFINAVKENLNQYLLDRGIDITIGGGQPGELETAYLKFPELSDYAEDIIFRADHPDYIGKIPEHKMDPIVKKKHLELPYLAKVVTKVKQWEEENQ